jgi:mannosyltransferase OCH1-like enzyme
MWMLNKNFFFLRKKQIVNSIYYKKKLLIARLNNKKKIIPLKNSYNSIIPLKNSYNSIIPLTIYQTWFTKNLPPKMDRCVEKLRQSNPKFNHQLYDDNDCRDFIRDNYDSDVLRAFDTLIPGAYKADLFRYCILYKNGGIYLDIKYECINNFKFIHLTESEHFVSDINNNGIYNALMICLPGNEALLKAIRQIVDNVEKKFYGTNTLEPTGPRLLSKFINSNIDLKHNVLNNNLNNRVISYKNINILKSYSEYIGESASYQKTPHYSVLWRDRNIYNTVSSK